MSTSKSIWISLLMLLITTCAFAQPTLSLTYKHNNFFVNGS